MTAISKHLLTCFQEFFISKLFFLCDTLDCVLDLIQSAADFCVVAEIGELNENYIFNFYYYSPRVVLLEVSGISFLLINIFQIQNDSKNNEIDVITKPIAKMTSLV